MTTTYVAFRSSDALHRMTDGFIQRMQAGASEPEPKQVEKIMTTFIEEALNAFFLEPASFSGLSGTQMRLIRIATDTINKATALVIGRSARKMDLQQNQAAAAYMDEIRIAAPDHSFWYVAFPISEALAEQGRRVTATHQAGDADTARRELVAYLRGVTDQALLWYFDKPVELLRFGPILRKVAAVGVDTTRRASYGVINKIIPNLADEQFLQSAEYYRGMQLTR
ncbi:hypothetical protein [Alloalcanivorax mobilis]|uniref:hypothetical protein n=1 Tax=Alloalcanivorax mobilis TaxID=2019569 RepID=UPI000B5B2AB4|nr:hypothetical protein [Alloalcanivorax mobilis]ASK34504.1 hypothetical protein CEK62_08960 [Alcanivorax sp. N3-2A]|tara:strand:+ start:16191 stop:16865 length:675 start_codon:yes stop_codon:yes gene_type:complete